MEKLEEKLLRLCTDRKLSIGLAESCTGGAIAARITQVPGASDYFLGSIVSYSNSAKNRILGVPTAILDSYSAVSKPTALMMLEGVYRQFGCDFGLAITGVAGPSGGTPDTPIGTVFIATMTIQNTHHVFSANDGITQGKSLGPFVSRLQLEGDRQSIIQQSVEESLKSLIEIIEKI